MTPDPALGIDFGTSNTYFCKSPGDDTRPGSVDFGTGHEGIATAILYRSDREPLVGDEALNEWGEATEQERSSYSLHIHFKPDIALSPDAARYAEDFLRNLVLQWERRHVELAPQQRQVVIGVPSETDGEYRQAVQELAERAGYGQVRPVAEPIGALLHHLYRKDLSTGQAQRGVLVVDFGGGTCDFAYMHRLEVHYSWGDMQLGGRLFDDLFYRWFLEQNPEAAEKLDRHNAAYYVHWHLCRELKEQFSRTMARDRAETVRKRVGLYGTMDGLTWDEFMSRARNYRPTTSFRNYLRRTGAPHPELTVGDLPHDLVGWFRGTLRQGLTAHGIETADIQRVILAGGSSQWPFVPDVIAEVLHLDEDDDVLLRSDRPYVSVGQGLALLPALQYRSEVARKALNAGLDEFIEKRLRPLIADTVFEVVRLVARDTASEFYDQRMRPMLESFREEGGTFASLEEDIRSAVLEHQAAYRETLREHLSLLEKGLPAQVQGAVAEWFAEHDLPPAREMVHMHVENFPELPLESMVAVPNLNQDLTDAAAILTTTIVAAVTATLAGGTGTALLAPGPAGLLAGAALGAVGGGALLLLGRERMKKKVKQWNVPRPLLKLGMSDRRLGKMLTQGRQKFMDELSRRLNAHLAEPIDHLEDQIQDLVRKEIDSLSAIDQI